MLACLLFALFAGIGRAAATAAPYTDSIYNSWYFTPAGVFGRRPLDKPKFRAVVRIAHPARDLAVVENVNPAGITTKTTKVWFTDGLISLITETNRWGDTYDSTWYRPDGPGKFLVTRRTNGVNPYLPAKYLQYSFKNDLIADIICFTDSIHAGPGRDGVAHYAYERYDDPNRRALIKSETFLTEIDMPAFSINANCHKVVNDYDENGDLRTRTIYDGEEKPTLDKAGVFRTKYRYDGDGNQTQIDYYDAKGELTITAGNYSEKQFEYKHGFLTEEAYFFDGQRRAMTSRAADSVSVITHKYDKDGNDIETDYFDKDHDPINSSNGAQQILNSYTASGMLTRTSRIPLARDSRLLGKIYLTIWYTRDDKGRIIEQQRVSNTGARLPDDNLVYLTKYDYDAWGRIRSASFWRNDSIPMRNDFGYHRFVTRYDGNGLVTERDYYNLNGESASSLIGYSRELFTYTAMGMPASRAWFDGDHPVMLRDPAAAMSDFHRIIYNYDLLYRLRSVDFVDEKGNPVSATLHPDQRTTLTARSIDLQFAGGMLAAEAIRDTGDTHPTLDCLTSKCLPLSAFETHSRTTKISEVLKLHTYHGAYRPDTLFENMIGFIGRDSILVFMAKGWSTQTDMACSELYRVAPVNKYYQFDGLVRDFFMDNDSLAASFNYDRGKLEGPAYIFYPNGVVKERGNYRNDIREGLWEYYYDNGQRERTLQYVQGEPELIDCYRRDGTVLARDGNGRFEGAIVSARSQSMMIGSEMYAKGNIKNGVPDGEWNLYSEQMTGPANTEYFSAGRFRRGISFSMSGKTTYTDGFFSNLSGLHNFEKTDHYRYYPMCTPGARYGGDIFPEVKKGFESVLASNQYGAYSGWVFLHVKVDQTGHILDTDIKLFQPNDEFEKNIRLMVTKLPFPGVFLRSAEKGAPYEKIYIVLVEGNQVVIPEQVLEYQRSVFR